MLGSNVASKPAIPVGLRLPLATPQMGPEQLTEMCRAAIDLGFSSFWVGDHILLPDSSASVYPHTASGVRPFSAETPWLDPLLQLTWLASQFPEVRVGTSIMIMTLRRPTLLAKQIATMSWLTGRTVSLGIGTGWLRDEYDAVGMPFEHRATRAKEDLSEIRELLSTGRRSYPVQGEDGELVNKSFTMLPVAPAPVEFLWGGVSAVAMRLVASSCDGWLPAKQSLEELEGQVGRLRVACSDVGRDFEELKLVVKPGPGPDPESGAVNSENLNAYLELGFGEAILEMPLEFDGLGSALSTLERVAHRAWL